MILRARIPLIGPTPEPLGCFRPVFVESEPHRVHQREIVLRHGMAAFGRFLKARRRIRKSRNSAAGIEHSQTIVRFGIRRSVGLTSLWLSVERETAIPRFFHNGSLLSLTARLACRRSAIK